MNKTELITFLRDPNRLSSEQLEELEAIVDEHPYFLSARLLLAKASKEQGHAKTKKRVASAAIYSTDRVLLKKYLNGNLFFLQQPAKVESEEPEPKIEAKAESSLTAKKSEKIPIVSKKEPPKEDPEPEKPKPVVRESKVQKVDETGVKKPAAEAKEKSAEKAERTDKRPSALKAKEGKKLPEVPDFPTGELDSILEELQRDMENLKASRHKFAEVQQKIEEDDAVSKALQRASSKDEPQKPDSEDSKEKEISAENVVAETTEEQAKKSAAEITMQILDAAKKAKEEVAREDAAEKAKDEIVKEEAAKKEVSEEKLAKKQTEIEPEEESIEEDIKEKKTVATDTLEADKSVEEKTDATDTSDADKPTEKDDSTKEADDSGRAERVIREPRFSRFATRSYLKPPEDVNPSSFLDDDKQETKPDSKETKPEKETSKKSKSADEKDDEGGSDKIKLPDLSKAKPVARRSKRKTKKEESKKEGPKKAEKEEAKPDKKEVKDSKKPVSKKKKEVAEAKKAETKPKKVKTSDTEEKTSKPTQKKSTTPKKKTSSKTTTKKTVEKKVAAKKTTATKKEGTKKATKTKSASKSKSDGSKEEKKDDGKGERKSQQDIIDKFIKESPSIKYQRKEQETAQDLAEQSAAWDPNLASEYLAEIYLHQGNKKRAIEIYEALCLKYPEKKSYFADLISKIE